MKTFLTLLLLVFSSVSFTQNKGFLYYQNVTKNSEDISQMKKYGLTVEINPSLVNLEYLPNVNRLIEDYKSYIYQYYRQINSITFLDTYEFVKLNKKNMKVQTLCFIQYKNRDYKWGGCKYFDIFHVFSDLYFTSYVKEYSDRFEMEVTVAEKLN